MSRTLSASHPQHRRSFECSSPCGCQTELDREFYTDSTLFAKLNFKILRITDRTVHEGELVTSSVSRRISKHKSNYVDHQCL